MGYQRATDGKVLFSPDMFPEGTVTNFVGCGDDITNGVEADGDLFAITTSSNETVNVTTQFLTWCYMAGGMVTYKGGKAGDYATMRLEAPASPATENTGAGWYDKYAIGGGINMFIPNGTQEGDWDLNLTAKKNSNVDFTAVVPVPKGSSASAFFNWDPDTEAVSLAPAGDGAYNLFDSAIPLATFATKVPLVGEGISNLIVSAVKPMRVLAHWQLKVAVYNSAAQQLDVGWLLYRGLPNSL